MVVVVGCEQWWWVVVPTGASASASAVSWEDGLDYWQMDHQQLEEGWSERARGREEHERGTRG